MGLGSHAGDEEKLVKLLVVFVVVLAAWLVVLGGLAIWAYSSF